MYTVKVTEKDRTAYNAFVADNGGSFLQSYEWGEWQEKNNRPATRYIVKDENNEIVLAAQVIRYPLPFGQYYMYCPYGPVKNLKLIIDNCKLAIQQLLSEIQTHHNTALFAKIEPRDAFDPIIKPQLSIIPPKADPPWAGNSSRLQPGSTLVLNLDASEEQLLEQMHKKTRYDIRIANKHSVRVEKVLDIRSEDAHTALKLIANTEERQNYKGHNLEYYQNLIRAFSKPTVDGPQVSIYVAKHTTQVLSSGIFIDFAGTRTYLFGGSSPEHREVMPAYALHWHLIRDAKEQGLARYDFWGIETSSGTTPGFVRFKLGFGGEPIQYPAAVDITWSPIAYKAYTLTKRLLR